METPPPVPVKKGLGPLGWIGVGCGGLIVLAIIASIAFYFLYAPKIKNFAQDAQKNPTRATVTTMVTMSAGQFEMVAEDDVNKRYTVREKKSGKLLTVYWSEKKNAVDTVEGDFSAIPSQTTPGGEAPPPPEAK